MVAQVAEEVCKVGWMEAKVLRVEIAGGGVGSLVCGGDVFNLNINFVGDAVGHKVGCQLLEVGLASALAANICYGHLIVHAQEDGVASDVVGKGLDG